MSSKNNAGNTSLISFGLVACFFFCSLPSSVLAESLVLSPDRIVEPYATPKQTLTVRELKKLIAQNQGFCPNLRCENSSVRVKNLTLRERQRLDPVVFSRLLSAARYLSQSWGDGILEGDYQIHEEVNLDHIEKVVYNTEVVAFRISYSARAWNLEDCTESKVESCKEGRIVESGFVTLTLRSTFPDEAALAQFKTAKN